MVYGQSQRCLSMLSLRRKFLPVEYVYLDIHQSACGSEEAVEKVLVHPVGQVSNPQRPAGSHRHEGLRKTQP